MQSESSSQSSGVSGATELYFAEIKAELRKQYPKNRLLRIVFHGHSVPAGYFQTPLVRRFESYPMLFHRALCEAYPTAVIDVCVTAIGGETSASGAKRFRSDVLSLKPDLVFIDYSLNDRRIGLAKAEESWRSMIDNCQQSGVPLVLLTPTPDSRENILDDEAPLMKHAVQVKRLGAKFGVPVVDSYAAFKEIVSNGGDVADYLSQVNHPNLRGHSIVADRIMASFQNDGSSRKLTEATNTVEKTDGDSDLKAACD